jgi:hypothetical protein
MCILLLTACGSVPSAAQLGLDEAVVKQAITLQLREKEKVISQYLSTNRPEIEINQIKINKIKSTVINNLSVLQVRGTYNLMLNLSRHPATQKQNDFELYLQRQIEGKTWRLLKQDNQGIWLTYSIYSP